ncbi:hypothetical protein GGR58DRAFT_505480 [Xylaria digitata]|nr:hypothetical protein GGR58DRAFT_505480 [Xylaria digitata]
MADNPPFEIIENNCISQRLDTFRALFILTCEDEGIPQTPDALDQLGKEGIQDLALNVLHALLKLPCTRLLSSKSHHGTIRSDLLKLNSAISSNNYDFDQIKPVLNAALDSKPDIYSALLEPASPCAISYSFQQSSHFYAGSFLNPEYRENATYLKNGTTQLRESILNIPECFRENETVGAGISSWVHRFDAVAKCYTADDGKERERERSPYLNA